MPDDKWGEISLMVTVLKPGCHVTTDELKKHCYTQLARYKVPKAIVFSDTLPYSPYGKVEKMKLRKQFGS